MYQSILEPNSDRAYLCYRDYDEWVFVPVTLGASPAAIVAGVKTSIMRDRRADA